MKWLKRLFFLLLFIIVFAFVGIYSYLVSDTKIPYDRPDPMPVEIPTFEERALNFKHNYNTEKHLPITGSGIIDVNNDQIPEFWVGGGENQPDALFQYENGTFKNVAKAWGLDNKSDAHQSYGPAAVDIDNDGDLDLFVCREDDVYLYTNEGTRFSMSKLNIQFNEKSTPVAVTLGDINKDGQLDLFVSTYVHKHQMEGQTIFLQEGYGSNSLLLANRGNGKFEDITESAGLTYTHNTFLAVFIDIDEDELLDLVVAHDTGEPRTYKNLGNEKFEMVNNPMTGKFSYPMGIGVGDYNNDGKPDFFFSNTGTTMPQFLVKGDLDLEKHHLHEDWMLLENKGNFKFEDKAESADIAKFEFAWGAIFEDFNLDGYQDLVVAENYVDLPTFKLVTLPCRFLVNTPEHKFIAVESDAGVVNKHSAITPLTADFNNDGYPDLAYCNIDGPARVWINNGGQSNYIKVDFDVNARTVGAKVTLTKADGKQLHDWLIIGEGLGSDQSHTLIFGLKDNEQVQSVEVKYVDGTKESVLAPRVNISLKFPLEESVVLEEEPQ